MVSRPSVASSGTGPVSPQGTGVSRQSRVVVSGTRPTPLFSAHHSSFSVDSRPRSRDPGVRDPTKGRKVVERRESGNGVFPVSTIRVGPRGSGVLRPVGTRTTGVLVTCVYQASTVRSVSPTLDSGPLHPSFTPVFLSPLLLLFVTVSSLEDP